METDYVAAIPLAGQTEVEMLGGSGHFIVRMNISPATCILFTTQSPVLRVTARGLPLAEISYTLREITCEMLKSQLEITT